MPSDLHEILVELFRNRGELAPALLRTCASIDLPHDRVELASIDLSQVVPTEYRADAVVELRDRDHALVGAVVVEIQLRRDDAKHYTWPLYVAALRAKLRCPVTLLVVTPHDAVAAWARGAIALGHRGFTLHPVVVAFEDLPRIVRAADAERLPELAVLSAMAHPELEVASAAIAAIRQLPEEQNRLYLDVVLAKLPDALRQLLEVRMKNYEYQSEFARTYYYQGRAVGHSEGHSEGRSEGHSEGRAEGQTEGLQTAVLAFARARLEVVSEADQAAILGLRDEPALTALIDALGRAGSAGDARLAFEAAIRPAPRG